MEEPAMMETSLKCCNRHFKHAGDLEAHISAEHFNCLPYECELCPYAKFPTEFSIRQHQKAAHGSVEFFYRCKITPEIDESRRRVNERVHQMVSEFNAQRHEGSSNSSTIIQEEGEELLNRNNDNDGHTFDGHTLNADVAGSPKPQGNAAQQIRPDPEEQEANSMDGNAALTPRRQEVTSPSSPQSIKPDMRQFSLRPRLASLQHTPSRPTSSRNGGSQQRQNGQQKTPATAKSQRSQNINGTFTAINGTSDGMPPSSSSGYGCTSNANGHDPVAGRAASSLLLKDIDPHQLGFDRFSIKIEDMQPSEFDLPSANPPPFLNEGANENKLTYDENWQQIGDGGELGDANDGAEKINKPKGWQPKPRRIVCVKCKESVSNFLQGKINHVNTRHLHLPLYACRHCAFVLEAFTNVRRTMRIHAKREHPDSDPDEIQENMQFYKAEIKAEVSACFPTHVQVAKGGGRKKKKVNPIKHKLAKRLSAIAAHGPSILHKMKRAPLKLRILRSVLNPPNKAPAPPAEVATAPTTSSSTSATSSGLLPIIGRAKSLAAPHKKQQAGGRTMVKMEQRANSLSPHKRQHLAAAKKAPSPMKMVGKNGGGGHGKQRKRQQGRRALPLIGCAECGQAVKRTQNAMLNHINILHMHLVIRECRVCAHTFQEVHAHSAYLHMRHQHKLASAEVREAHIIDHSGDTVWVLEQRIGQFFPTYPAAPLH